MAVFGAVRQRRAIDGCDWASADVDGTDLVEVRAELVTIGRNDEQLEAAAGRLGLEPSVTSVRWHVVEQMAVAHLNPDSISDG